MFTGIVSHVGHITQAQNVGGDLRIEVDAGGMDLSDVVLGESIMHNGVCLTVTALSDVGFSADLSSETLAVTTAKHWQKGTRLNLERSLTLADRLGGHLVSGHVDGIGLVLERKPVARAEWFLMQAPESLAKYISHKGWITVDGTSLTVNKVDDNKFELTIIPHTLDATIIGGYQAGTEVNLEVDLLVRYLERLRQYD